MALALSVIQAAQAAHRSFYPRGPFASVTLAQFILESNWGKVQSGKNNFFGIKATAEQISAKEYTSVWTHETEPSGQYVKVVQNFANYKTPQEGFMAHASLLCTPHYSDCIVARTPEDYCVALQKDGYATGIPGHPYSQALIDLINSENLKQYDQGATK